MSIYQWLPVLLFPAVFVWSCDQSETPIQSTEIAPQLVWADEFDYEGLPDSEKWGYDVGGHGWGNQELQYYTQNRPENARVENGVLVIEAHKEAWSGNGYSSARLVTRGKASWKYGRFEIRAKLPEGRGTWPAIWMLPDKDFDWPEDGEIDIMEHVGFNPGVVHGTIHTEAYNHSIGTQKGGQIQVSDAMDEFHTYAIEWSADSILWFLDDTRYFSFANEGTGKAAWPFNEKFYMLFNIAVGGTWGGQQGVDENIWPQRMEIDYIRIYQ